MDRPATQRMPRSRSNGGACVWSSEYPWGSFGAILQRDVAWPVDDLRWSEGKSKLYDGSMLRRGTNDADATVVVESRADFEVLKDRLADYGFTRMRSPHRLQHNAGGLV